MSSRIIDLTHRLELGMPVFPGDPPFHFARVDTIERALPGELHVNLSRMDLGLHCGTHLDAPLHFVANGAAVETVSLDAACGPCLLLDFTGRPAGAAIAAADLAPHAAALREKQRVVLHTGWSGRWRQPDYFAAHPVLADDAGVLLADCGVRLVGVDAPSVDQHPHLVHRVLLDRGVLILENLTNLAAIRAGEFTLMALPLKIAHGEASPVRAIAVVAGAGDNP